jgi:hypothetical protein
MSTLTRDEGIRTLEEGCAALNALFAELSDEQMILPATIGEGDWAARDLMAHVETWEAVALQTLEEWRSNIVPMVEEAVFARANGTDELNAERIQAKRALTLDEVRTQFADTHRALVDEISHMDDEEWDAKTFYPTERRSRLGTLLGSVTGAPKRPFGHAFAHVPDLQAFVSSTRNG